MPRVAVGIFAGAPRLHDGLPDLRANETPALVALELLIDNRHVNNERGRHGQG